MCLDESGGLYRDDLLSDVDCGLETFSSVLGHRQLSCDEFNRVWGSLVANFKHGSMEIFETRDETIGLLEFILPNISYARSSSLSNHEGGTKGFKGLSTQ